jgi:hypothetical protein
MARVTVRMSPEAEQELAAIYLESSDPQAIVRASYEIDALLTVDPETKGTEANSATNDDETAEILLHRTGTIPPGLRSFPFGPLEVFFTADEADGMATIWLLRWRR